MKTSFKKFNFIILAVVLSSGIMYSQTDFWEPISTPSANLYGGTITVKRPDVLTVAHNGDVWVETIEGLFLSTDNGDTWVPKITGDDHFNELGIAINLITINPMDNSILVGSFMKGLYRSTDYGNSWTMIIDLRVMGPDNGSQITAILHTPSGEIYVAIAISEELAALPGFPSFSFYNTIILYSKDNGNTWIEKNNGLPPILTYNTRDYFVRSLALGTDGTLYAAHTLGVYRSTDGGDNWLSTSLYVTQVTGSYDVSDLTILPDGSIFATTSVGVFKSTDKGITWEQLFSPNINNMFNKIMHNSVNGYIFAGYNHEVFCRSTDLGKSWYKVNNGLPKMFPMYFQLAINPNTGMLFFGHHTDDENIRTIYYRSTTDIYSKIDINIEPESISFGAVQAGSHIDTILYITNKGETDIVITAINIRGWDASSFSIPDIFNDPVTLKPNETLGIHIAFTANPNIGGIKNATLEIVADVSDVWISLNGYSLGIISKEEPNDTPTDYSLSQNYPNPFNPTTKIQYSLPEATNVKLSVYNSMGQEVMQLVNENQTAGKYIVDLNAQNLQSGVYFYRLQTGKFVETKKMLLLK